MPRRAIRSGAWMLLASLGACGAELPSAPADLPGLQFRERADPLAPDRPVLPWRPPRQMAAFVHPHEDPVQGALVGGHWIVVLLGRGSWYYEEDPDREPVPDQDASAEELGRRERALEIPAGAVVPFRPREGRKP